MEVQFPGCTAPAMVLDDAGNRRINRLSLLRGAPGASWERGPAAVSVRWLSAGPRQVPSRKGAVGSTGPRDFPRQTR